MEPTRHPLLGGSERPDRLKLFSARDFGDSHPHDFCDWLKIAHRLDVYTFLAHLRRCPHPFLLRPAPLDSELPPRTSLSMPSAPRRR